MSGLKIAHGRAQARPPLPRVDVDGLRAQLALSDVVGRRVKLKRSGRELVGLCPFHTEKTASFGVNDQKGVYYCLGCGASGDAIRFVMETEGLRFLEATRWLGAEEWPAVDPIAREVAAKADSAERLAKIADAQAIWAATIPSPSTPAEFYLQSRGITAAAPWSVRYAATWAWKDYATGECGPDYPALIGAVQNLGGEVVGIQRIFLRLDGQGKARMAKPKRSLGRIVGCALRLGPPVADRLIVCEGPEDGLTLSQAMPDVPVWVALGTAVMPMLELPDTVRVVTLAGDNNPPGVLAVESAGAAFIAKGVEVRTMFPDPAFVDFNDELRGISRER